jgi:transposase
MAERKNKGGRPSKATAETMNKILDGIKAGMSYEGACGVARVSWVTFDKWRKAGEAGESEKFIGFLRELRYAEAIAEAEMLKKLKEDPDTKWVAWRLERRFPDRWGKKEQVKQEISGPEGKPIQTETKITSVDILKDYPHLFSSNADDTKE